MHAYLLVTKEILTSKETIKYFPKAKRVVEFNIKKIADIKDMIKFTNVSLSEKTVFFLPNFDSASLEAQNAFLKTLEEPQENLSYVLSAQNEAEVLPTIISRCNVIYVQTKKTLDTKELDTALDFVNSGVSQKFEIISKLSKREDALEFLENFQNVLRHKLAENPTYQKTLELAAETHFRIKQNANPTLQMINFIVSL